MPTLKYPSILIDLGHVGTNGLPLNSEPWFQRDLNLCRDWGFKIQIVDGRVRLSFDQEQLVPYWIQKESPAIAWDALRIHGFLSVGSTNSEAMEMARRGAPGGTLVYAEEQTAGKGRRERTWYSPAKAGLYMSLILRPAQLDKYWPLLTHVASVAVVDSLRTLMENKTIPGPLDMNLKWPNDVLLSGRKCAGVLLEASQTQEKKPAAVIGIGINVHQGSYPEFLASKAACLDEMAKTIVPRRLLLVQFLYHFQLMYLLFEKGKHAEILEGWKSISSMWNGIRVRIDEEGRHRTAVTCGLNEYGSLLVRTDEGALETVHAGDIRILGNGEQAHS
jgi:BirA family biotin operon repressor/biotin-[acetyl-CoA-carboxylase] ligase